MYLGYKTPVATHRYAYALFRGPIPKGLLVCHTCDIRLCVNPDHLYLGTAHDNATDAVQRGQAPRGDRHYAHLHPEYKRYGSDIWNSRLVEKDVLDIIGKFGSEPAVMVAKRFGVSAANIRYIRRGVTWGWLTGIKHKALADFAALESRHD